MNKLINYSITLIVAFCRTRMTRTPKKKTLSNILIHLPLQNRGLPRRLKKKDFFFFFLFLPLFDLTRLAVPCSCVRFCRYLIYY